ncbi:hypothetical protein [Calycomorphotria hydatis]|uniref:SLA1 homology domain-containing protein n=1 Tax=Calycomorphotria hydatis TaxID=2528027 RepID=A0A517TB74_9PLAN|nr:hypothetical protein [Calycomorphotria hydatis]QDT65620.1 hypothetical protein V22_28780 [Calycomorphotria hydatis]
MNNTCLILLLVFFMPVSHATAEDTATAIAGASLEHEQSIENAKSEFQNKVREIKLNYIVKLQTVLKAAATDSDLKQVEKIAGAIKEIQQELTELPDEPDKPEQTAAHTGFDTREQLMRYLPGTTWVSSEEKFSWIMGRGGVARPVVEPSTTGRWEVYTHNACMIKFKGAYLMILNPDGETAEVYRVSTSLPLRHWPMHKE